MVYRVSVSIVNRTPHKQSSKRKSDDIFVARVLQAGAIFDAAIVHNTNTTKMVPIFCIGGVLFPIKTGTLCRQGCLSFPFTFAISVPGCTCTNQLELTCTRHTLQDQQQAFFFIVASSACQALCVAFSVHSPGPIIIDIAPCSQFTMKRAPTHALYPRAVPRCCICQSPRSPVIMANAILVVFYLQRHKQGTLDSQIRLTSFRMSQRGAMRPGKRSLTLLERKTPSSCQSQQWQSIRLQASAL